MSDLTIREASAEDRKELASFAPRASGLHGPGESQEWLLAASRGGELVGCIRVRRSIGRDLPRYWYHVGCVVHAAPELRLFHEQRTLLLNNDHTGAVELADLACRTTLGAQTQSEVLRALVRAALLLLARERETGGPSAISTQLIAEAPGVHDANGRSPFWESLGRHFYDGDPRAAAERFGPVWRSYVAALLPRDPLVASFLSEAAQQAIGEPADAMRPVAAALCAEGFRRGRYITIDDAGPVLEASSDTLPTAKRFIARAGVESDVLTPVLIAPGDRLMVHAGAGCMEGNTLALDPALMQRASLRDGDEVWAATAPDART